MINNVIPFRPLRRSPKPDARWLEAYLRFWNESLDRLNVYVATLNESETIMSDLKFDCPPDEATIVVTRSFDAPRALVWAAFTRPEHVIRWWGPASIAPVRRIDKLQLWPGGSWRYVCERPDGSETIIFTGIYLEVTAPEKLVNTFGVEGQFVGDAAFPETHRFEERDGKTFYRGTTLLPSFAVREQVLATGMEKGGRESMEQLARLVDNLQAAAK